MSVYRQQATNMTDVQCLKKALEKVPARGGKTLHPEVHKDAVQLEGYHGDKRTETAEVVIPRAQVGGLSNDIGFKKQADGSFQAIISDYDRSFYNEKWMARLKTEYVREHGAKIMKQVGATKLRETTLPNGKIRLQYSKN